VVQQMLKHPASIRRDVSFARRDTAVSSKCIIYRLTHELAEALKLSSDRFIGPFGRETFPPRLTTGRRPAESKTTMVRPMI